MSMDVMSSSGKDEQRARQRQVTEELKASGALEGIFAQVDAGAPLTGSDGVLSGVVKAALEQGLAAELTEHLGYASGETRTRVRIPTRATEAVLRRSPLRSGRWTWTSRGTGPGRSRRCWCPRGSPGAPGASQGAQARRRPCPACRGGGPARGRGQPPPDQRAPALGLPR